MQSFTPYSKKIQFAQTCMRRDMLEEWEDTDTHTPDRTTKATSFVHLPITEVHMS